MQAPLARLAPKLKLRGEGIEPVNFCCMRRKEVLSKRAHVLSECCHLVGRGSSGRRARQRWLRGQPPNAQQRKDALPQAPGALVGGQRGGGMAQHG